MTDNSREWFPYEGCDHLWVETRCGSGRADHPTWESCVKCGIDRDELRGLG